MKTKVFLISGIAAIGLLGAGTAIGWSATNGSHHSMNAKAQTMPMHSAKDMRAHMQTMHPSLSKSQIDQLIADCQKNAADLMNGAEMMDGTNMMGDHASHHSRKPLSGTTSGSMMGGGGMG